LKLKHLSDLERSMTTSEALPKSLIKLFELEVECKLAMPGVSLATLQDLQEVAKDMTALLNMHFGGEEGVEIWMWGFLKAFPHAQKCTDINIGKYRKMAECGEIDFIQFMCDELRSRIQKYKNKPVLNWFFYCMLAAVERGRYGFLANRGMLENLHTLGGIDKDVLSWTQLGCYFHFFAESKQMDTMDLTGAEEHYSFFRDIELIAMPTFASKLAKLVAAYEKQSSLVESLRVKLLAVSVSIMITSGQLAVKYLMSSQLGTSDT